MKTWMFMLSSWFLVTSIYSQDAKLPRITAPGVIGPVQSAWDPLGPIGEGYIFSLGFLLTGNEWTSPLIMWMPKPGNDTPMEVKSIASINAVVKHIIADKPLHLRTGMVIEISRRLIAHMMVNKGRCGFSLSPEIESNMPEEIISRLRKAGLSDSDAAMLRGLAEQARLTMGDTEWVHSWFEVDSLGSVEKITVCGTIEPAAVRSFQVEAVFEAGRIDVEILKQERSLSMDFLK